MTKLQQKEKAYWEAADLVMEAQHIIEKISFDHSDEMTTCQPASKALDEAWEQLEKAWRELTVEANSLDLLDQEEAIRAGRQ